MHFPFSFDSEFCFVGLIVCTSSFQVSNKLIRGLSVLGFFFSSCNVTCIFSGMLEAAMGSPSQMPYIN